MTGNDVVVADDDQDYRELLQMILEEHCGATVRAFASGEAAVRAIDQAQPGLLLVDCHLPGMDGAAVTRLVRARHPAVRIVAISGAATGAEAQACLRAGAIEFVAKADFRAMAGTLRRLTAGLRQLSPCARGAN